ncbi:MAG: hypothetical protein KAJ16_12945, partial [Calditrichia bacterium]|nr:hypothetical protein [Calditrichia bacterium]
ACRSIGAGRGGSMPAAENEAFEINLTFKWYYYSIMTLLLIPLTGHPCLKRKRVKLHQKVNPLLKIISHLPRFLILITIAKFKPDTHDWENKLMVCKVHNSNSLSL